MSRQSLTRKLHLRIYHEAPDLSPQTPAEVRGGAIRQTLLLAHRTWTAHGYSSPPPIPAPLARADRQFSRALPLVHI
ncbi:MAG: hypothetical protein OXG64_03575 [Chloroflexi bacterium]|nr:hypothetical protein [Chloroflexota bacterium]